MHVYAHACASTDSCGVHVYKCVHVENKDYLQGLFLKSCLSCLVDTGSLTGV